MPNDIFLARLNDLRSELGSEAVVRGFGDDVVSYAWVETFVKDRVAREEIKKLQARIAEIQKLPIDKDELKNVFRARLLQNKIERLDFLRNHIEQMQRHETSALSFQGGLASAPWVRLFLDYNLTEVDIDSLFIGLEQGVTQGEKDKKIAEVKQEIAKLEEKIEKKLSPRERWFYSSDGERIPYPKGDRWGHLVRIWEEVASRHSEPVDFEGHKLSTHAEKTAYALLRFGEVPKRAPLREGSASRHGGSQPKTTEESDEIREEGT